MNRAYSMSCHAICCSLLAGCATTVTTPGGVAGVYASDINGLAGEWRSEAGGVTRFEIRREGESRYELSSLTPGYEDESLGLFVFSVHGRTYVEGEARSPAPPRDREFNYYIYEIESDALFMIGGNGGFPEDWGNDGLFVPEGPRSELPVPPHKRAEILDAMFESVRLTWTDEARFRFVRVKQCPAPHLQPFHDGSVSTLTRPEEASDDLFHTARFAYPHLGCPHSFGVRHSLCQGAGSFGHHD